MDVEWDEAKRQRNIRNHGIDFERAKEIWQDYVLEIPSHPTRFCEERFLAVGQIEDPDYHSGLHLARQKEANHFSQSSETQ